eukprot:Lithocolla_globosa_v1_NODE_428_length_4088_cov_7.104885.p2 type:complete len:287 gc:universal NODE_428_length_4088_cov_7.104885:2910-2050(-)
MEVPVDPWVALFSAIFHQPYTNRVFLANFGIPPDVCQYVWVALIYTLGSSFDFEMPHLLWTLCFLKTYEIFDALHLKFNCSEKTYRTWTWKMIFALHSTLDEINPDDRFVGTIRNGVLRGISLFVDTTPCRIQRPPSNVQRLFYSGKFKYHLFKYEFGVRADGLICWFSECVLGAVHDLRVLETQGLLDELLLHEIFGADLAYLGCSLAVVPYKETRYHALTPNEIIFNQFLASHRIIVERAIGRFKIWACMAQRWRHNRDRHTIVARVCANLTNLHIRKFPLFAQ